MASVTVERRNGKWRLRWRQPVTEDGVTRRRQRSVTVSTQAAAIELRATILRALETQGYYTVAPEPEPEAPPSAGDLEQAAAAWLMHKAARLSVGTRRRYASLLTRIMAGIRDVHGLGEDDFVPVTVLSRDLFSRLLLLWQRESLSEATTYSLTRVALDVWRWAAEEPEVYPLVPMPPFSGSRVLARPPTYVAPAAPTLAEMDACIRRLAPSATIAYRTAIMMRYTGLRAGQALGVRASDVDLVRGTLRIRKGKSRREKAEQRVVPLSPHLVSHLRSWLADLDEEDLVVPRSRAGKASRYVPSQTLKEAWHAATEAGEARREVWWPPNRRQSRPDHAFRAGFQSALEDQGVRSIVVDFLVGHAPASVRGKHYSPAKWPELEHAVRALPPIDWQREASNVVSIT